jgi:protein-disulfide isomerase
VPRPVPRPAPRKQPASKAPLLALLGLVAAIVIVVLVTQLGGKEKGGGTGAVAMRPVPVVATAEQIQRTAGISMGAQNAPITIYEFADFQCPHCAQFVSFIEPLIKQNLVDTGRARYVFYDFPLPNFPFGFLVSRGGRCANEQGKFWEFHNRVYQSQQEWSYAKEGKVLDLLTGYARELGLNADAFNQCLRSDKYAQEVSQSQKFGESLGVGGTPTLFVNGRKVDTPNTYKEFEAAVREIAPNAFADSPAEAPAPSSGAPAAPAAATPAPAPAGGTR